MAGFVVWKNVSETNRWEATDPPLSAGNDERGSGRPSQGGDREEESAREESGAQEEG